MADYTSRGGKKDQTENPKRDVPLKCNYCGHDVSIYLNYCFNCGKPVKRKIHLLHA